MNLNPHWKRGYHTERHYLIDEHEPPDAGVRLEWEKPKPPPLFADCPWASAVIGTVVVIAFAVAGWVMTK